MNLKESPSIAGKNKKFYELKRVCAGKILDLHKKAKAGHIGSSLSCLDILIYSHFFKMKSADHFILSKGHAASALYTILAKKGLFPEQYLETYYRDGTLLAAHPPAGKLNGITFGTGSLGHGLSLAAGIALSARFSRKKFQVYCVLSDGDCNEGSTWEAALFAGHHGLGNLTVIIDNNEMQALGKTKEVLNLEPLKQKWASFNFTVAVTRDGNNFDDLHNAFGDLDKSNSNQPKCLIAKTKLGHGVSFMEDRLEWHYLPMNDEQYQKAKLEIKNV
ncbi:MAG: transketolase, beta subunit [Parcubacteria group bacterium Gr01-1014_44]|nr:MAG: transketolase, beta subunit [Parcubacteria group bacterium Gr01-1014_44]